MKISDINIFFDQKLFLNYANSELIEKWDKIGLLHGLDRMNDRAKCAALFELALQYMLSLSYSDGHVETVLFPVLRRLYKYITPTKDNIKKLYKELYSYYDKNKLRYEFYRGFTNMDVDVELLNEFCDKYQTRI